MIFNDVKTALAPLRFNKVVWMGADEINRRKGHNYLKVFADLIANPPLYATRQKDASIWKAFAEELLKHNGHPKVIQHMAVEINAAYAKGDGRQPR